MTDEANLTIAAGGADPDGGLKAVRSLRVLIERLEALQVTQARAQGWSWQEIADRLGVTRQAVHRKYATGRSRFSKEK